MGLSYSPVLVWKLALVLISWYAVDITSEVSFSMTPSVKLTMVLSLLSIMDEFRVISCAAVNISMSSLYNISETDEVTMGSEMCEIAGWRNVTILMGEPWTPPRR